MPLASLLVELPAAELALNSVIWCLVLHLLGTSTCLRLAFRITTDSLPELHRLQLPLGNLASRHWLLLLLLLLSSLSLVLLRLLLESHFLGIRIFINPLARSISSLPLVFSIELLTFVNKDFLANLMMFMNCLLIEFTPTRVTLNQPACIAILIWCRLIIHSPSSLHTSTW